MSENMKTARDAAERAAGTARPQLSVLPYAAEVYQSRGLEYGGDKYARGNYYGPPPAGVAPVMRVLGYLDAARRHLGKVTTAVNRALGTGGDVAAALALIDDDAAGAFPASGLPHLAHALSSLGIAVELGVQDGLLPADPGQPWKRDPAYAAVLARRGEATDIPQKNEPDAERRRVLRRGVDEIEDGTNGSASMNVPKLSAEGAATRERLLREYGTLREAAPGESLLAPYQERAAWIAAKMSEKCEPLQVKRSNVLVNASSTEGITNALLELPGVERVKLWDAPGAIEVLVTGGDSRDIAETIAGRIAAGVETLGNCEHMVGSGGFELVVRFSRPRRPGSPDPSPGVAITEWRKNVAAQIPLERKIYDALFALSGVRRVEAYPGGTSDELLVFVDGGDQTQILSTLFAVVPRKIKLVGNTSTVYDERRVAFTWM